MVKNRSDEMPQRKKSDVMAWAKEQDRSEATCVKLPEGVEPYKLTPGVHQVDFMPYAVGEGNPAADEGMEHFERKYDAHRIPTPTGHRLFACRQNTFHRKCAACHFLLQQGGSADQELVKKLRVTTRHLWLVNDKPGDPKNPLKVFDSNHFNKGMGFGEMMKDAITAVPKYVDFTDLKKGFTLQLTVKEQTAPGMKFNAVTRIDFLPRDYSYPQSSLEKAPCLDDMLVDPGYDAVRDLLTITPPEKDLEVPPPRNGKRRELVEEEEPVRSRRRPEPEEEEETPRRRQLEEDEKPSKAGPPDEDDDEEDDDDEEEELKVGSKVEHDSLGPCTVKRISPDGKTMTLVDEQEKLHKNVPAEEVDLLKEDKDDRPTGKAAASGAKQGTPAGRKTAPPDDDDDDDSDDPDAWDEAPPRKARR